MKNAPIPDDTSEDAKCQIFRLGREVDPRGDLNLLNDPRGWSGVVGHRFSEDEPCEKLWIMESIGIFVVAFAPIPSFMVSL